MSRELKILSGAPEREQGTWKVVSPEEKLRHFRNVNSSLLKDAADTWRDIWCELEGSITEGTLVLPDEGKGLQPKCGWPEFLEKMWLLGHYLDYAKRFCEGKE